MVTFKTDRPDNTMYIFKKLAVSLLFLVLVSACLFFLFVFPAIYVVVFILLLQGLIDTAATERLREISFDTKNRQVIFLHKTFWGSPAQKRLPFDRAVLLVKNAKPSRSGSRKYLTLCFFNSKTLFFEISNDKDGFSADTLRKIFRVAELIPLQMQ